MGVLLSELGKSWGATAASVEGFEPGGTVSAQPQHRLAPSCTNSEENFSAATKSHHNSRPDRPRTSARAWPADTFAGLLCREALGGPPEALLPSASGASLNLCRALLLNDALSWGLPRGSRRTPRHRRPADAEADPQAQPRRSLHAPSANGCDGLRPPLQLATPVDEAEQQLLRKHWRSHVRWLYRYLHLLARPNTARAFRLR